jgi:ribonuclease P protein component
LHKDSAAFPKTARLLTKPEYQQVFDWSCKSSDRWLVVLARPNEGDGARIGFAISRKSVKRAVDRNRIKRVLRETFRLNRADLPKLDFVVLCRAVVAETAHFVIRASFLAQLEKVRQRKCAES